MTDEESSWPCAAAATTTTSGRKVVAMQSSQTADHLSKNEVQQADKGGRRFRRAKREVIVV